MNIQLANSADELKKVAPILCQLRPQYSISQLVEQIEKQQENGYQVAYIEKAKQVVCVAGFVISEKLAWQKHMYIDDLVTDEHARGTGVGSIMLDWLKRYAIDNDCQQIHLDSGVQRFAAHRFYLNAGFNIASHHFSNTTF
ncbi:GNAT family N-acetyltransferase [Thalassotalea sp. M1531]|uniref:GNAT family N-acetyltransferase n=1 Tax=Thalassotalea algicola TaxID=2716224 RepID=A0A7Y0LEZ3_9GAMM|nr:GNAT family N-acetyltransferase [Thalassotalea algicola]NMP33313.1 GNAT family N-acetyltransferase [Thalassotalea algicola]